MRALRASSLPVRKFAIVAAICAALIPLALPARAQSTAVTIQNFAYQPGTLQVPIGATVVWSNKDGVTHTVTSDTGAFDSGNVVANGSYSFTFSQAGTFAYHCKIHPFMTGQIVVGGAATSTSVAAATPVATSVPLTTSTATTTAPTATVVSTTPAGGAAVLQVSNNPKLGAILVNGAGLTLYTLSSEAGGVFKCTGGCLNFWPPMLLPSGTSAPTVGTGVTGLVGTIKRPEGGVQVTYQGLPLYTFARDKAPGDINGNGIVAFGGTWRAAAVQSVPLSALPAEPVGIRIVGARSARVVAHYLVGTVASTSTCASARCTLYVPRRDVLRLKAAATAVRFAEWKITRNGQTRVVQTRTILLTVRSSTIITAVFTRA